MASLLAVPPLIPVSLLPFGKVSIMCCHPGRTGVDRLLLLEIGAIVMCLSSLPPPPSLSLFVFVCFCVVVAIHGYYTV